MQPILSPGPAEKKRRNPSPTGGIPPARPARLQRRRLLQRIATVLQPDVLLRKLISELITLADIEATSAQRILIRCPGCAKKLKARREDIGKKARCSTCETKFRIRVDEPDDPSATILGLPREADHVHRDGERFAIGGDWLSEFGWGHDRVVVEVEPDLKSLLSNGTVDSLWPDDQEYREFIDGLDDPTDYLRNQWTICYLHHPRVLVLNAMLSLIGDRYRPSIGRQLARLLSHEAPSIRTAAAQSLWAKGPLEVAAAFRQLREHKIDGAQLLCDQCPEAYRDQIEEIHQRNYVEWPEGVEDLPDELESTPSAPLTEDAQAE